LENELTNHQFRIDTVLASGQDLIDSNHYASDEIEERCEELNGSWEQLMGAAAERKQKLSDALEGQQVSECYLTIIHRSGGEYLFSYIPNQWIASTKYFFFLRNEGKVAREIQKTAWR